MTQYQRWSGRIPSMKHIRTFGAPVIVKIPGDCPSKGHPHVYHGIFLRFPGTAKNIVHYDTQTGTVKVATHKSHDEFQYGSDKDRRSKASRYMIDLIADNVDKKRYCDSRIEHTIEHLLPSALTLGIAVLSCWLKVTKGTYAGQTSTIEL